MRATGAATPVTWIADRTIMTDFVFFISAATCIITAFLIVLQKNPVYSVVYMLPFFLAMTVIFVLLQATFLAAIQMIVYGGAILVIFLFVIMLINLKPEELKDDFKFAPYALTAFGVGMLAYVILFFARHGAPEDSDLQAAFAKPVDTQAGIFGTVNDLAAPLFKQHAIPFELASVLIVVAILGAVLLSKKRT